MRGSICVAAGLLVTNIALLQRPASTRLVAKPTVVDAQPRVITGESTEGKRLRWFWQAKHNGLHMPACEHFDPVAVLDADVDPAPGNEHVIGNRQFGVMMFDAQGSLLAHMDPLGCGGPSTEDQSLSLSVASTGRLAVHTRDMLADGEHLHAAIAERTADELVKLVELDTGGHRTDWEVGARIVMTGTNSLEVIYHGRKRANGEWVAVDNHCTWQLAPTLTFSCRTRAGEQTPGSE